MAHFEKYGEKKKAVVIAVRGIDELQVGARSPELAETPP